MKPEKIAKLLQLGEDQPNTEEGKSALKRARRELDRLGLKPDDVRGVELVLLEHGYPQWKAALVHAVCLRIPCDLLERNERALDGEEEHQIVVRGPGQIVEAVAFLYSRLERAVTREAFGYGENLRLLFSPEVVLALQLTFSSYAVVGLSERLMVEAEDDEKTVCPEGDNDSGEDASEPIPDPLDKLLSSLDSLEGNDLPLTLDPSIEGYRAGLRIELNPALGSEPVIRALTVSDEPLPKAI